MAETALREPILAELRRQQVYLLNGEEAERLGRTLIVTESFTVNPACVGQSPQKLAALAGFGERVGPEVRVLAAELAGMGKQFPLSAEKLSPVLALFFMPDRARAFERCRDLLHFGGLGHTCVIHAQDEAVVRDYGAHMPAYRVVVNSPAPLGSIGATTNLFPAMTLGCGAIGGNITSDNIGPQHLLNIKRIAWNQAELPAVSAVAAAATPEPACACQHAAVAAKPDLRATVERILAERGIRPGTEEVPQVPPSFAPPPVAPKPKPVAFVCEADVREAVKQGKKIPVGPKTIITPAAHDLGRERDVFQAVS